MLTGKAQNVMPPCHAPGVTALPCMLGFRAMIAAWLKRCAGASTNTCTRSYTHLHARTRSYTHLHTRTHSHASNRGCSCAYAAQAWARAFLSRTNNAGCSCACGAGMGQSPRVAQELGLADRELELRLGRGMQAPQALYLASLHGGPRHAKDLVQVCARAGVHARVHALVRICVYVHLCAFVCVRVCV